MTTRKTPALLKKPAKAPPPPPTKAEQRMSQLGQPKKRGKK